MKVTHDVAHTIPLAAIALASSGPPGGSCEPHHRPSKPITGFYATRGVLFDGTMGARNTHQTERARSSRVFRSLPPKVTALQRLSEERDRAPRWTAFSFILDSKLPAKEFGISPIIAKFLKSCIFFKTTLITARGRMLKVKKIDP